MSYKNRHEKAMEPWKATLFDIKMKMEKANQQLYEKQAYPDTQTYYSECNKPSKPQATSTAVSATTHSLTELTPLYPIPYRKPEVFYTANVWEMLITRRRGVSTFIILFVLCLLQLLHTWVLPEIADKLNIAKLVCICLLWIKFVCFVRSGKLKEFWES